MSADANGLSHAVECWRLAADALAEEAMETLPATHSERRELAELLTVLRVGDGAATSVYREWRRRSPRLTAAMTHAGRRLLVRRKAVNQ
jgi:hypothetical protein